MVLAKSLSINGTLVTSTATKLNYTDITTLGIAEENKILSLDNNKDITGIHNLSSTNLTGTLQTNLQPNITSLGTLTELTCSGIISITNSTASTSTTSGALVITGGIGINGNAYIGGNANINGTLTINGTPISSGDPNGYLLNITPGTALPSKALILDSSSNITGINSLSTTSIIGTLSTSAQPNITSLGTLTSLNTSGVVTHTNSTASTSTSTGALIITGGVGIGGAIYIGGVLNATGNITGTLETAAQPNITSLGTLTSLTSSGVVTHTNSTASTSTTSGALVVTGGVGIGGAIYIGGILNVTGNITGTLETAAQTNITSLGTLTGLTSSGIVSITNSTASTTTTNGALVVTGGVGIGGVANLGNILTVNYIGSGANTPSIKNYGGLFCGYGNTTNILATDSTRIAYGSIYTGAYRFGDGANYDFQNGTNLDFYSHTTFLAPKLQNTPSSTTITTATTCYISGPPVDAGNNYVTISKSYALYVATGNIYFGGSYLNITGGANNASIDLGSALNDYKICLYSDAGSYYGIGASASHNQYLTSVGHKFRISSTRSSAGTEIAKITSTGITVLANTVSSSTGTGSLILYGGAGISGIINAGDALNVSGIVSFTNSTASTSTTSGALVVTGGVGIGGATYIGGVLNVTGNITGTIATTAQANITSLGTLTSLSTSGVVTHTNSTVSTSTTSGALVVTGGVGIGGATYIGGVLNVTGNITGTIATAAQTNITSLGTLTGLSTSGVVTHTNSTASTSTTSGALVVTGGVGIGGATYIGGNLNVTGTISGTLGSLSSSGIVNFTNSTASTSTTSGALVITGGVGIGGATYIGGNLNVTGTILGTLETAAQTNITSLGNLTTLNIYGTSTTPLSILNSSMGVGTERYISIGNSTNSCNAAYITFNYVNASSTSNALSIGLFTGSHILTIAGTTNVGIGNTSPSYKLDINGTTRSTGILYATSGTASTSTTSGALVVTGGVGISGATYIGGNLNVTGTISGTLGSLSSSGIVNFTNSTASTSTTSGALVVTGGVGIGGATYIGGNLNVTGTISGTLSSINTSSNVTFSYVGNGTGLQTLSCYGGLFCGFGNLTSINATDSNRTAFGNIYTAAYRFGDNSVYDFQTNAALNLYAHTSFIAPRLTNSPSTTGITTGTTCYISGPPVDAGNNWVTIANPYSLYIASGRTYLGGGLTVPTFPILIGTSTDTNSQRMISGLNSSMSVGTGAYLCLGQSASVKNQAEISFYYAGSGSNSNRIDFGFYGGSLVYITAAGRLGIGTSAPSYQLQLSTDSAAKPSTTTWTVSSDSRLKDNIISANLDTCYNNIKNIRLVRYTWKDTVFTNEEVSDRSKLGWIAQEVEPYFPKAVESTEQFGYSDCKTLNADQLYASLYGAVQKLIEKVEQQETIITDLQSRINILENPPQ